MWNFTADPRTEDLFFIASPIYPFIICGFYCCGVLCLSKFMEDRKPYDLNSFARIYDIFSSSLNATLLIFVRTCI